MSFVKKTWKDRLSEFARRYTVAFEGENARNATITLNDGTVSQEGDKFNAATMNDLENRIEAAFESIPSAGVNSFNGRTGNVLPDSGDYTSGQITHVNTDDSESDVRTEINDTKSRLETGGQNSTEFYFDYQGGKYGWNENSARGAGTFHPFKLPVTDTKTITSKTTTDLGEDHTYRYIDTTGVANTNTETYAFPANDTGGTKDLGASNDYRYVNAQNVYTKGKADGQTTKTFTITSSVNVSASSVPYIQASRGTATLSARITVTGNTVTVNSFSLSAYCYSESDEGSPHYKTSNTATTNSYTLS
jgi:hypothetical protein